MVELKNLRIGNWILPNSNEFVEDYNLIPTRLDEELIGCYLSKNKTFELFDYIELTPKLLENFGFEKCAKLNYYSQTYKLNNFLVTFYFKYFNEKLIKGYVLVNECDYSVKYLHQLQNVFYFTKGIELNDIVAYDYYLKLNKEKFSQYTPLTFEEFLEEKQKYKDNYWAGFEYKLGDFPPNLFL